MCSPVNGALSPSAIEAGWIRAGSPAASAAVSVAADSGSTPTTRQLTAEADAGDEPTAADGDNDRVDIRQVLLDLERKRAVTRLEHRVVERVHERPTGLFGKREQAIVRLRGAFGVEIHLGAVGLRRLHLARVRVAPHEDPAGRAVERGRVRRTLGSVARRPGDDAASLLLCRERRDLREHPARLERAGALEELGLEVRVGADALGKSP